MQQTEKKYSKFDFLETKNKHYSFERYFHFTNDYEFTISEAKGNWQDNMGNYGKSRILFYIENEKNGKAYIKGLGQLDDQINNKFWFIPVRKSDQNAGVGKINFIDVPKNYKFLLKSNCNYAINYFENRSFMQIIL